MCNALNLVSKAFQAVVLLHAIAGLIHRAISMTLECWQYLIKWAIHPTPKGCGLSRLIVVKPEMGWVQTDYRGTRGN
jgi:hypothetical protein